LILCETDGSSSATIGVQGERQLHSALTALAYAVITALLFTCIYAPSRSLLKPLAAVKRRVTPGVQRMRAPAYVTLDESQLLHQDAVCAVCPNSLARAVVKAPKSSHITPIPVGGESLCQWRNSRPGAPGGPPCAGGPRPGQGKTFFVYFSLS